MASKKTKTTTVQYVMRSKIFPALDIDDINDFMANKNISHIDTLQLDGTGIIYVVVYWLE